MTLALTIASLAVLAGPVHPERSRAAAESKGQNSPEVLVDARMPSSPSGQPVHSDPSTPDRRSSAQGERTRAGIPAGLPVGGARLFAGMGRTPEEQARLDAFGEAIARYEEESLAFQRAADELIETRFRDQRAALTERFEQQIRTLEVMERKERLDAIAEFEEFIRRYPNEPRYTPDVMFRLAELYYERSADDQLLAMRAYQEKLAALSPEQREAPPPEPQVDFGQAIAVYHQLLSRFPDYRLQDAVWYLLGYCLEKEGNPLDGLAAYQQLIARYPKSRFVTEAWVRIGEHYFDDYKDRDALDRAAHAYEQAIRDPTHPLYDKALYKLGWTYYRGDKFELAVARFLTLIDFYRARSKKEGVAVGGDLLEEALQYTAISFADPKWGSLQKAEATFAALGGRPYEAEIYRRLGEVYFQQAQNDEAIAAWRVALARAPLGKDAPQIEQRIVEAYQREQKLDLATAEAEQLSETFRPGSTWFARHAHDPDLLEKVRSLGRDSLYQSAVYHHQQALALKQKAAQDEARHEFETAAKEYARYLERFPRSKRAYQVRFYAAECEYDAGHFDEAARDYAAVRDSTAGNQFFHQAALDAVLAREQALERARHDGKVAALPVLRADQRPPDASLATVALAPEERALVDASDAFLSRFPADEKAPDVAYRVGELVYAHNDFPEARRRFEAIVDRYPKSQDAQFAANLIVETYLATKDWRGVEEVAGRLASDKDVIDPNSALYRDLVKFKLAGRFKRADELLEQGDYANAAKEYIALVDEDPRHAFADKALNNAAVAYEKDRRFDSAMRLYQRIVRDYPRSPLAAKALFRVAVNAENAYDFDAALAGYQRLVANYPKSPDREAALFNEARLYEGEQRYREAADAFLRYGALFPRAQDASKNQFRAVLIDERQQDWRGELRALVQFVRDWKRRKRELELVIDAERRMGDAFAKLGQTRDAIAAYRLAADDFDRRHLDPVKHTLAADAAAQARFRLAELQLAQFERMRIHGRARTLERSFAQMGKAAQRLQDAYAQVFRYKRLAWTLAALYRRGYVLERFGATILATPVPPEVTHLGDAAVAEYQDLLSQRTAALQDRAIQSYVATLAEARKDHVSNEWTRATLEALARYRPSEYPVLKTPRSAFADAQLHPLGFVGGAP